MERYVASWSQCSLPLPNVKLTNPSAEEERAWLYAILKASQQAFTVLFPEEPREPSLREAKRLAELHERGKEALPLAKAYVYASSVEWPSPSLNGQPFSAKGMGVVSVRPTFIRKAPCGEPAPYLAAFAAKLSEWAVSRLRELEGISPSLSPSQALQEGRPLHSKQPLWINLKAVEKAYPEVRVRKPRGRRKA